MHVWEYSEIYYLIVYLQIVYIHCSSKIDVMHKINSGLLKLVLFLYCFPLKEKIMTCCNNIPPKLHYDQGDFRSCLKITIVLKL